MREKIAAAMKAAMKSKDEVELSTLRLMSAAIKAKDIDHRASTSSEDGVGDDEIILILATMVKQRNESAESYKKAKRKDLMERELAEIKVIQKFLPKQLSDDEVSEAIAAAIEASSATSLQDIGKVMAELKANYAGQIDFAKASGLVKKQLSS